MYKKLILIFFIQLIWNCAQPARPEEMKIRIPSPVTIPDSVYIREISGGLDTNPFLVSRISNPDFHKALKDSILESEVFSKLGDSRSNWEIQAEILEQHQPYVNFDTTCFVRIKYSIRKHGEPVQNFIIEESGSAGLFDSLRPIQRVQIANERAVRANLRTFLQQIENITI